MFIFCLQDDKERIISGCARENILLPWSDVWGSFYFFVSIGTVLRIFLSNRLKSIEEYHKLIKGFWLTRKETTHKFLVSFRELFGTESPSTEITLDMYEIVSLVSSEFPIIYLKKFWSLAFEKFRLDFRGRILPTGQTRTGKWKRPGSWRIHWASPIPIEDCSLVSFNVFSVFSKSLARFLLYEQEFVFSLARFSESGYMILIPVAGVLFLRDFSEFDKVF